MVKSKKLEELASHLKKNNYEKYLASLVLDYSE